LLAAHYRSYAPQICTPQNGGDRMLRSLFQTHPASVGETYFEHLKSALGFGLGMIGGGMACMVHALLPFLFTSTGSRTIARLHDRMIANRTRLHS
jgi:hypothetical protein